MRRPSNRTPPRSTAAVRDAERSVKVQVADVGAAESRPGSVQADRAFMFATAI